jgi:hypothetical protein
MRTEPSIKKTSSKIEISDEIKRYAAIVVAFISVFGFLLIILLL